MSVLDVPDDVDDVELAGAGGHAPGTIGHVARARRRRAFFDGVEHAQHVVGGGEVRRLAGDTGDEELGLQSLYR